MSRGGTTLVSEGDTSHVVIKLGGEVIASPEPSPRSPPTSPSSRAAPASSSCTAAARKRRRCKSGSARSRSRSPVAGSPTQTRSTSSRWSSPASSTSISRARAPQGGRAKPVGLHGASSRVIAAEKRPPQVYVGGGPDPIDLGLVGDVVGLDTYLLELLIAHGYTPVLACLGADADGQTYNINADTVANRVASTIKARGLVMISDVIGVLRDVKDKRSRIPSLSVAEGKRLIAEGIVCKTG